MVLSKAEFRDYRIPKKVLESWKKQSAKTPVSNSAPQYQHDAYMVKKVKDGNPYISTVFGRAGSSSPFKELTTKTLKIKGNVDYEIQISAGDLNGADCTYYLQQDQTHVISNKTGVFTAADGVHEKLDRSKKTYAVVKTADGKRSDYEEVNIEIEATTYLQKAQDYLTPGTKLNLLGDDFAKFTVPSNFPLVGGAEISFEAFQLPAGFEFDVEEGSLQISIGANIFEMSKNKGDKKYSKEMFSNWKDLTKQSISQSIQDKKDIKKQYDTNKDVFMNKWGTGKIPPKSSKNWGISAIGYIEIVFNENGYVVKEACISVEGEFSFKYNVQAGVGPIPVYFYVEAGASLGGTALGVNPVEENVQLNLTALDWDFSIKFEPKIKAGGGAGIKDFASVGIYAKATLPITFAFKQKHLTMDLKGEFGVEAELWLLKASAKLLDGTVHIIDRYWDSSGSQKSRSAGNLLGQSNENEIVYSLVDRDYASNTSAWLGGRQGQRFLKNGSSQKMVLKNLQTSVYPNAVPQVVAFGDKLLMAWIEDAADRDDYNRMRLMYSVYSNGVWSQPAAVYDNGNNDNLPVIVSDGTDVYFAWQKQASVMNADSDNTFSTIMSDVELYTAKYNAASQTIGDISRVTENNCYDYAQQLSVINGKPVLYWVSCNDSQPLGTGNNTLHRMELGKNEQILEENLNFVLDLDAAVVNGTEEVSFATDKDGNYDITDDVTVFTYSNGTLSEFAKKDDTVAYPVLFYGNPDGQTTLFVSDMTNIYYSDNGAIKSVLSESVPIEGNLQFVGNANKDMLIWTQKEEKGNAIYSSSFENGEWTSPIAISNSETTLTDVNAVMYRDRISGVCTSTALTYDNETESYNNASTNLCAFNINDTQDLALEEISIDERDISIGEAAPFTVRVSNLGCGVADSVTFTVTDDLGSEYTQTVDMQLNSGESSTVTLNYTAPENYQKTFLHVTAAADGFSEYDTDNNTIKQEIGIPKLMIKQSGVSKIGSEYILNAIVTNESDIPLDSAVIKLCNGYEGTEEINFVILTDVAARSTQLVEFSIPEELPSFDSSGTAIVSMEINDDVASSNKESVLIDKTDKECAHPETSVRRTEPTCTDAGKEYVYCDACGELISENDLQPLGHDVHDGVCSICENAVTTLNYGELTPVEYREGSNSVIFSFVPAETKDYCFYSDSSIDPYVTLYDSKMTEIDWNYDGGDGYNFLITHTLEKDKTYYFYVSNPSSSQKYYVTISDSFTSSHSYTMETVLPTCEEEGYTKYTCRNCGYIYSDNFVQPSGHNVQNGQCTDCGRAIDTLNVDRYSKATMTSEQPDAIFMFVPETDGVYYFCSDSTADTYGALYNDKFNELTGNDDGGDGSNFKISYTLEKDKIYYLKARFYSSNEGEFFVKVTQEYTSCHNYEIQTVPPTCEEEGYTKYTCRNCGYIYFDNFVQPSGHNVQNGQCTDCGCAVGTLNVDRYSKATMTSEQPDAIFMFVPETDGEYYFYSDSAADTYGTLYNDKFTVLTNDDEGGDGSNFKISYTLEKDKIYYLKARFYGSNEGEFFVKVTQEYTSCHNYEIQTVPPTCTEQGYDLKKCTVCGTEDKDNYTEAKGHNVQNGQCTDCGRAVGTLNVDRYSKATMTSEQPDAIFMFVPETDGVYHFCSDSTADTYGALYNDKFNELTGNDDGGDGRNFKISYTLEKDKIYYLKARFYDSGEGEFFVKVTQEYTSCHNYEIQTVPPTCTEQGYDLHKCTVCGEEYTDNYVDSLNQEHQYVATIVRPTCSERGYTVYRCSLCNHEYISDYIARIPHNIVDNQCVVCGKSGPELYESNHPYFNNTNQDWVIHKDNAKSIEITFSEETNTESNCDYIYIYDKDQNEIGCYSGTQLSGKTIRVEGDTATIRLVTDGSIVYYGFSLTDLKINYGVVGDSNLNGKIDIKDATAIQRHLANIEVFNDTQLAAADVNSDGTVSIKDATLIQMYCAEIIDSFNGTGNSEVTEPTNEITTEPTTESTTQTEIESSASAADTSLSAILRVAQFQQHWHQSALITAMHTGLKQRLQTE